MKRKSNPSILKHPVSFRRTHWPGRARCKANGHEAIGLRHPDRVGNPAKIRGNAAALTALHASRLAFIDSVFASDGERNLKCVAKAEMLGKIFPAGFIYAGDSNADLRVWRQARGIVLVNARKSVTEAARAVGRPMLELS